MAYCNRGIAKSYLGDKQGAITDYIKAIEIIPKYANAFNNRGSAKKDLGDKQGACSDWKKASELGNKDAIEKIRQNCK